MLTALEPSDNQLLDDGHITDSQGRKVNFKNTVIIMTSNIGSSFLLENIDAEGNIPQSARDMVLSELNKYFRPEFLNRIDDIVLFSPLKKEDIIKIIDLSLKLIQKRLNERNIAMSITSKAKQLIADKAYTPIFGARPVKRYLQKYIETEIGKLIIQGDLADGNSIQIDTDGVDFQIKVQ